VLSSLGGEMPGITQALMAVGAFIGAYFYIIIAAAAAFAAVWTIMRRSARGAELLDAFKLKLPVAKGIIKGTACVRFSRSLAMLLRSGIGVAESLRMTGLTMINLKIRSLVLKAADGVEKGDTLKSALSSLRFFPELLLRILAVAESTGHTDDMLDKAADVMEEDLDKKLGRLTTVLEPALILTLSIIIGIVLVSVILPVARIMNAVG